MPMLRQARVELAKEMFDHGFDLIPLHKPSADNPDQAKRPRRSEWTTRPSEPWSLMKKLIRLNYNVGTRLRADDLVIDADPRNYDPGDKPLKRFCEDTGLKPRANVLVKTGGGGYHIYLKKPPNQAIVTKLREYPGLDFLSVGRMTIIPGSLHPSGAYYEWLTDRRQPGEASADLLALIDRPDPDVSDEPGELEPDEIAFILGHLPVDDFDDHDDWFKLMASIHHASGGSALEEFVDWSTTGSSFADHGDLIAYRWSTLGDFTGSRAGMGTLRYFLSKHKALHILKIPPHFDEFPDAN